MSARVTSHTRVVVHHSQSTASQTGPQAMTGLFFSFPVLAPEHHFGNAVSISLLSLGTLKVAGRRPLRPR